jgi:hypothetical protein
MPGLRVGRVHELPVQHTSRQSANISGGPGWEPALPPANHTIAPATGQGIASLTHLCSHSQPQGFGRRGHSRCQPRVSDTVLTVFHARHDTGQIIALLGWRLFALTAAQNLV